jgi:nonspecific dipeptidase
VNWKSDPFELTEMDEKMFGRGTSASKGPAVSWLWAVDAYQQLGRELPVNLKLLVEGAKEVGSEGLDALVTSAAQPGGFLADVDYFCISANSWLGKRKPCVTYGLRGLCHFTAEVVMGTRDLHSGMFGGTVHEAMTDVAMLMGKLVDPSGKILIPGIYDTVDEPTPDEAATYDKIDFDLDEYADELGLLSKKSLAYDNKQDVLMHRWRYPALSLHGIEGAFSDPGEHSVIPHRALLKFSIWLVPSMDPKQVSDQVNQYLQSTFDDLQSGNALQVEMTHGCKAWLEDYNTPHYEAAKAASQKVHGIEADLTREGSSVPITVTLAEATGKSVCMLPVGASDDGAAAANEKFNISNYMNAIKTMGMYLEEVAKLT